MNKTNQVSKKPFYKMCEICGIGLETKSQEKNHKFLRHRETNQVSLREFKEFLVEECYDLEKYKAGKYDKKIFDWWISKFKQFLKESVKKTNQGLREEFYKHFKVKDDPNIGNYFDLDEVYPPSIADWWISKFKQFLKGLPCEGMKYDKLAKCPFHNKEYQFNCPCTDVYDQKNEEIKQYRDKWLKGLNAK
jgi:hypothetical protein